MSGQEDKQADSLFYFGPLFLMVALFGATAIVAQVLLLREALIVVAGNELFLAVFFGCWFAGIVIGAAVGAFVRPRSERLALLVPLLLLLQVVALPLLMIGLRGVRTRWGFEGWQLVAFLPLLAIAFLHLAPFSFLTGLTFPMLCRLAAAAGEGRASRSIGQIFALEALGSLAGGLAVTFLFAVFLRPLTGAWLLGLLTAANLAWFAGALRAPGGRLLTGLALVAAIGFAALLATPARSAVERRSAALRHGAFAPGFLWLDERYTPYQHLALVRRDDQYSLLSNGQFIASFPEIEATSRTVHVMMSQSGSARRLLVIGGGETGLLRVLLTYPEARIDYVEIDPQILDLVLPYLEPPQREALADPRVRIVHEDPRRFVRRRLRERDGARGALYDVVLLSAPDPSTAAVNRFYTRDFFAELRRLLGPSGVLVTSIGSGVTYFDAELLNYVGSVYQALRQTFGHVLATPGTEAILFATDRDDLLTSDVQRLIARYEARGVRDAAFSPLLFHTSYERGALRLVNDALARAAGGVRPNTDLEPVTYLHHLRLWHRFSGGASQALFAAVEHYDWRWAVAALVALGLLRLGTFRRLPFASDRAAWRHAVVALFAAGFAGMAASILLLLLFQNHHGSLYREVGLLVALFMAGLTIGSWIANRAGPGTKAALLARMGIAALFFGLFFFLFEQLAAAGASGGFASALPRHPLFFHAAMVVAGLLTGLPFPLVGRLAVACGRDPGRAGGLLEATDHAGAGLGALATGVVLIPVSGVLATMRVVQTLEVAIGLSLLLTVASIAKRN